MGDRGYVVTGVTYLPGASRPIDSNLHQDSSAPPTWSSQGGRLDVRSTEGRHWRIDLRGELDLSNAHLLNQELHLAEVSDAVEIVVDLSRLDFMDSSGLHLLLRAFQREPERLRLHPAPPPVQSVFRVTRTESLLPFMAA